MSIISNSLKFKKENHELENPSICGINRLSPRSNLVPALKQGVYYKSKQESELLYSLNGDYRFAYCKSDIMPEFYGENLDDSGWDTIDVPSMWQFRGYGEYRYTNINYPFPFNPPYICEENPVGYYRKKFDYTPNEKTILYFGGVDNAYYVYLNGEFVGFSKGSRIPAEFDVTNLIKNGENLLCVKVFTYSDASYLENQDMLMASGIFRDVYLIGTNKTHLWDYRVTTDLKGFNLEIDMSEENQNYSVEVQIDNIKQTFKCEEKIKTYIPIENPKLWNSEEPNLYDLFITVYKNGEVAEIHSKKIGMMHSTIQNEQILVNGSPIYIKGVNRHEYDCKNGRAISVELIEKELKLIKENNLNAVRCSHYTNHPAFYELCSEIGLFVMDEYDLETHGSNVTGDEGYISKLPEWLPSYMDRTERALKQNKNETCIFLRSMCNECGAGQNLIECLKYTLEYDPYHAAIHDQEATMEMLKSSDRGEYDFLYRCGYLSAKELEDILATGRICMQVEYAHAMGNSPGYLEQYQGAVYNNENYIGGFVWEFKNHGFYKVDDEGNEYYLYGGDLDEPYHWGNFCLDGYLMSNGTPKHSWYELGEVFAPIYLRNKNGKITVKNTYNFRNLNTLKLEWNICEDYKVIKCSSMELPSVLPHNEVELPLDLDVENKISGARYFANLIFKDGEKKVATRQIELPNNNVKTKFKPREFKAKIENKNDLTVVSGNDFSVSFKNGMLCGLNKNNKVIFDEEIEFNLFRAPTDNDGITTMQDPGFHRHNLIWHLNCLQTVRFFTNETACEILSDRVVVETKGKLLPTAKYYGLDVVITYEIFKDGVMAVDIKGIPYGIFPERLPRIGIVIPMKKQMENVCWYGRGDRENYSDCKLASPIGIYEKKIWETYTVFDMPQESGNHENTVFVQAFDSEKNGLSVIGKNEFSFSYHDFTLQSLTKAMHKNELKKSDKNYLYIDYKMRGLGSLSCGPEPEEEFELRPHSFEFAFIISASCEKEKTLELCRADFGIETKKLDIDNLDKENKVKYKLL